MLEINHNFISISVTTALDFDNIFFEIVYSEILGLA